MATASYAHSSGSTSFIGSWFSGRSQPPPAPSDYESSYAGGTSYEGSYDGSSDDESVSSDENQPRKFERSRDEGQPDYDSDGNSIEEFEVIGDKNLNAFARQLEYQRDPYRLLVY